MGYLVVQVGSGLYRGHEGYLVSSAIWWLNAGNVLRVVSSMSLTRYETSEYQDYYVFQVRATRFIRYHVSRTGLQSVTIYGGRLVVFTSGVHGYFYDAHDYLLLFQRYASGDFVSRYSCGSFLFRASSWLSGPNLYFRRSFSKSGVVHDGWRNKRCFYCYVGRSWVFCNGPRSRLIRRGPSRARYRGGGRLLYLHRIFLSDGGGARTRSVVRGGKCNGQRNAKYGVVRSVYLYRGSRRSVVGTGTRSASHAGLTRLGSRVFCPVRFYLAPISGATAAP